MATKREIDQHKKILGILFIVFSVLHIAFIIFIVSLLSTDVLPIPDDELEVVVFVSIAKYALITITLLLMVPSLIAGIGLLQKKDWALTLAFVIGIIGLLGFPLWTFIGIYAIVVFILAQSVEKSRNATDLIADQ